MPSSPRASTICIMSLATKAVLIKLPSSSALWKQRSAKLDAQAHIFPIAVSDEFPEPDWVIIPYPAALSVELS